MTALVLVGIFGPSLYLLLRNAYRASTVQLYTLTAYSSFATVLTSRLYGVSIVAVFGLVLAAAEATRATMSRSKVRRLNLVDVAFLLFLVFTTISVWANNVSISALAGNFTLLGILLATKFRPSWSLKEQGEFLFGIVVGGAMLSTVCIVEWAFSPTLYGLLELPPSYERGYIRRATGLQYNANGAALYLAMGACATMALLQRSERRKLGYVFLLALHSFAILLTQSRAGVLALGAMLVLSSMTGGTFSIRRLSPRRVILAALCGFAIFPVVTSVGPLAERDQGITSVGSVRSAKFERAFDAVLSNPLVGDPHRLEGTEKANYHNDLLQVAADDGLPSAVAYSAVFVGVLWRPRSIHRRNMEGNLLDYFGRAVLVVGVIVSISHTVLQTGVLFWLALGLLRHQGADVSVEQPRIDPLDDDALPTPARISSPA